MEQYDSRRSLGRGPLLGWLALNCIDRAVANSPPPLDDVGGIDLLDLDEFDPERARLEARCREWMIDEAVRRTSRAFCVLPEKLFTLFSSNLIRDEIVKNFRMIVDQADGGS